VEFCFHITHCGRILVLLMGNIFKINHMCRCLLLYRRKCRARFAKLARHIFIFGFLEDKMRNIFLFL